MNAYGLVHKISPVASFSSSDLKIPVGLFTQPTRPHCGKCQRNLILAEESKKLLDETNHKLIGERVEKEELKLKIRVLEELVGSMKKLQRLGGDSGSPGAWEHPDDRFQSSSYSSWPFDTNLNLDLSGESSIKVEPLEIIDDAAPARGPLEEVEPVEICENYNVADEFSETPGDHNHSCPSESGKDFQVKVLYRVIS